MLETMFRPGDVRPVAVTLLIGLLVGGFLIGRGLWRAFGGPRVTIGRLMVAVMVVALGLNFAPLGFLMAVLAPVLLTLIALMRKPAIASGHGLHDSRP